MPVEIGVSIGGVVTKEPLKVRDGMLAEAKTPAGFALAYVCPRKGLLQGSLFERTGILLPNMQPSPYDNNVSGITGEGLWFGGDVSLFFPLLHPYKWHELTSATKILYHRTYDSFQGKVEITITAVDSVMGRKVRSLNMDFHPALVPG